MSTSAQIAANQLNAQHSSGPKTEMGKAISALNNFRHGFTGAFCILEWEQEHEYDLLYGGLLDDHRPSNTTEHLLVKTMAQSYWLRQRALTLQQMCFKQEIPMCKDSFEKDLALYMRYQTTHDRAFNKALDQLQNLRAEKRKEQIGFESQERKRIEQERKQAEQQAAATRHEAQERRCEAAEHRAQELHQARLSLTEARTRQHETKSSTAAAPITPHHTQEIAAPVAKTAA